MEFSFVDHPVHPRTLEERWPGYVIDMILLHHSAGQQSNDLKLLGGWEPTWNGGFVSSNWYVGEVETFRLVLERYRAWHAGSPGANTPWVGRDGNSRSVGVEAKNLGTAADVWEDVQLARYLLLVRDIQRRNNVPQSQIIAHKEYAPGRKPDPAGPPWTTENLDRFRALVMQSAEQIIGDADMTVGAFQEVLIRRKSKFAPVAAEIYQTIVQHGIRPTVALGFHIHEGAGMGSIVDTHLNWGAVRTPEDAALAAGEGRGYARYSNLNHSVLDWCKRITGSKYLRSQPTLTTVEQVALRYAPFTDNNSPWAYALSVHTMIKEWKQIVPQFYFPETGFAVDAGLVDLWRDLGGIGRPKVVNGDEGTGWTPGPGYPISALVEAPDGKGAVQWFERCVLGVTPEGTPRWVLIQEYEGWERPPLARKA